MTLVSRFLDFPTHIVIKSFILKALVVVPREIIKSKTLVASAFFTVYTI